MISLLWFILLVTICVRLFDVYSRADTSRIVTCNVHGVRIYLAENSDL